MQWCWQQDDRQTRGGNRYVVDNTGTKFLSSERYVWFREGHQSAAAFSVVLNTAQFLSASRRIKSLQPHICHQSCSASLNAKIVSISVSKCSQHHLSDRTEVHQMLMQEIEDLSSVSSAQLMCEISFWQMYTENPSQAVMSQCRS